MTKSYYLHPAGYPTRGAVIDVGLKCMHRCKFCYYSYLDGSDDQFKGMRRADFRTKEHIFKLIDSLVASGFLHADITGGEPTLHPDIVEIIKYASDRGLATRIITLGQYLMRRMHKSEKVLLDELIDNGVTNFLMSMHQVHEEKMMELTGGS
ncbi:MAG: radical SAM protein, partial [Patescibacteria group bacterium]|nr:radical SAM protein [Patescibacteria group bacterium]